jgi:hypothetical protein
VNEAPPPGAGRGDRLILLGSAVAGAAALLVVLAYLAHARILVGYPWDWSPDEGLSLDYARRVLDDPASLYPRRAVPFPSAYGPLVPVLMSPLVLLSRPLAAARLLALAWTAAGAAAVAVLVRRRAGPASAAAAVALYLAPFDLSFWHALVRVDGPMIALWLWAAVPLLPRSLDRGVDVLSRVRLAAGTSLLLASILVKPTAALLAAPLVLGWFLVDRRSARRLVGTTGAAGLAALGTLQVATGGGFLWVNRLWALHPWVPGLPGVNVERFWALAWPVLVLALATGLAVWGAGGRPHREGAVLLLVGGLAMAPLLGKHGASWNYLLPFFAAAVVAGGRWASALRAWPAAAAALALVLAATRPFPLPTAADEATARAFYGFTQEVRQRSGGPLLVARPDLVYFLAGQEVEIEGSSFLHLAAAGAPGTDAVLRGLKERRYALVVWTWPLPDAPEWTRALLRGYVRVGECRLGWYFGPRFPSHLALRRDLALRFDPAPGTRCAASREGRSVVE